MPLTELSLTHIENKLLDEQVAVQDKLYDLVHQHLPALASAWAAQLSSIEGTSYSELPTETIQETLSQFLRISSLALRPDKKASLQDVGRRLGRLRWPVGFTLKDISTGYQVLKELLLTLIDTQPWNTITRDAALRAYLTWSEELALAMLVAFQELTWQAHQRRTVQLERLNRLAVALSQSLNLDTVLQTAMQVACDLTGAKVCRIHLPDEQGQTLHLKASLSSTAETDKNLASLPIQGSVSGLAFSSGQLVVAEKLDRAPGDKHLPSDSHQTLLRHTHDAFACVPLCSKGQSRGVMSLVFSEERPSDDDEKALLTAIGHQVGMALENAQLFEQESRQRQIAETLGEVTWVLNSSLELNNVLGQVLVEMEKVLPYDSASIMLLEGDTVRIAAARGFTDQQTVMALTVPLTKLSIVQQIIEQQQPMVIPDARKEQRFSPLVPEAASIRGMIKIPLISREQVIGVLNVDSRTPHHYSAQDAEIAFRFAQHVAGAIANTRLMEEARRRTEELTLRSRQQQALLTIFPAISGELRLETLLQRIVEEAVTVIPGAQRGSIIVRQANGFHFMGAVGYDLAGLRKITLLPEHLVHRGISADQIMCIRDISEWERQRLPPQTDDALRAYGMAEEIKETLCAPILVEGKVFGHLNLDNLETYDAFGPLAYEMVELFAAQAAVAITNARLHGELEETVRRRTEEIRHQRDRIEAILHSVADGVVVTNLAGEIVSTNPVAEGWLYHGEGENRLENQPLISFIGRQAIQSEDKSPEIIEFLAWEQKLEAPCWQLTGCVYEDCPAHGQEERPCWHIPGAYCLASLESTLDRNATLHALICPARDKLEVVSLQAHVAELREEGTVRGTVIALRDISRLRVLDRLKSQFVSTVSHELRTPLANIKLYHSLLKRGREDKRQTYMDIMGWEIVRLERLIQDILDLSRLEMQSRPPRQEAVDIAHLLQELIETHTLQADSKGLTLHLDLIPEWPEIYADRNQLFQVFTNLLTNALNYTPDGGHVWLTGGVWHLHGDEWRGIGSVQRPDPSAPRPPDGDWAVVSIRDTGVGISPQDQPRIFDRFYRGEQAGMEVPGTGLGLTIVREILDLHQGHILVESELGVGSTFSVLLPLSKPEKKRRISVLVADDEEQIAQLIHRFLSREGIQMRWVPDGQQVLEAIAIERPDLLILDLAMPVMDGYQVLEQMQNLEDMASLPVLVLSSWTEDKFQRVKRLGAADFLTKPFSGAVLVDAVKRLTAP